MYSICVVLVLRFPYRLRARGVVGVQGYSVYRHLPCGVVGISSQLSQLLGLRIYCNAIVLGGDWPHTDTLTLRIWSHYCSLPVQRIELGMCGE